MRTFAIISIIILTVSCKPKDQEIIQTISEDPIELPVIKTMPAYFLGEKIDWPYIDLETSKYKVTTQYGELYYDSHWFKSLDMADSVCAKEKRKAINFIRNKMRIDSINNTINKHP